MDQLRSVEVIKDQREARGLSNAPNSSRFVFGVDSLIESCPIVPFMSIQRDSMESSPSMSIRHEGRRCLEVREGLRIINIHKHCTQVNCQHFVTWPPKQFAGCHLYTCMVRGTVRVKCFA